MAEITPEIIMQIMQDILKEPHKENSGIILHMGEAAKDRYVTYCRSLGWSEDFIQSTIVFDRGIWKLIR